MAVAITRVNAYYSEARARAAAKSAMARLPRPDGTMHAAHKTFSAPPSLVTPGQKRPFRHSVRKAPSWTAACSCAVGYFTVAVPGNCR